MPPPPPDTVRTSPPPSHAGSVTRTFLATYIGMFALLLVLFETRVKYTEGAIRRLFGFMFSYGGRTVFLIFLGAICFGMLSDSYKDTNVRGVRPAAPCALSCAHLRVWPRCADRRPAASDAPPALLPRSPPPRPPGPPTRLPPPPPPPPSPPFLQAYTACWGVGLATLCNALFNCFIICSHPGFQSANRDAVHAAAGADSGGGAPADPSKLTDAQIRAYLAAHPEVASAAMMGGVRAQPGQPPADGAAAGGAVAEWGVAKPPAAAAASGGGFGGFFGGGGKKKQPSAPAADVEAATGYVPPAVPAAAAPVAWVPPEVYAHDPFKSPAVAAAAGSAPLVGGAPASSAGAPTDDANPFESGSNPFGGGQ